MLRSSSSSSSSDSEFEGLQVHRLPRVFRHRINFYENITDFSFKEKFRISKTAVQFLIQTIGQDLTHETRSNKALLPEQQILCTLHWLGCGAPYHIIADAHGLSKATVNRSIKRVCTLLVQQLLGEEVRWPTTDIHAIPQLFVRAANFPRVAGVVDGSLVKIDAPHENEFAFVDRDGDHSINVMVVCGPNLEFFYASARWPGSVHDSRVLRCSSLAQQWDNGWRPFPNAILLGDSGYGLRKWLISPNIPIQIPRTEAVRRFLRCFKSTRRLVENSLGILKEKFACLNYLRLQPLPACKVILSCLILHNIEKRLGSEKYVPYNVQDIVDEEDQNNNEEEAEPEAINVLQDLIQHF